VRNQIYLKPVSILSVDTISDSTSNNSEIEYTNAQGQVIEKVYYRRRKMYKEIYLSLYQ
jgi:hypothetical protein